ncbi:restriction endonuclease subunit S [Pseudomonas aeruginosa]|uniref:restriction endonuclease subunit S n=1 Tax=Pseudomonas aeruginosa TaxID=287 RepID=UPI000946F192|nr:restriction endonuclease subunit S [Pseudomonas aeruginosa]
MTMGNKSAMAPKLRFPEFRERDKWASATLGQLFSERQEVGFTDLPLLSLMDKEGIIPQDATNRKNNSNADKSKYLRVFPGDIAYNTMRMWEGRCAYVGIEGVVSPAYTVCKPVDGTHSLFFAFYFKTPLLIRLFRQFSQGLVKDTLNLKYQAFSQIKVTCPKDKSEQRKIADCLRSLDEIISTQEQKIASLKVYKRDLIQQLFPLEGETLPRLRFPEFRNAPEWEPTTLDVLVDFQSGGTPSKANPAFWNGSIPWISAKDMKRLFLDDSEDHISAAAVSNGAKLAPAGTVLVLTRGMTLLKDVPICVLRREMSFNQDVKALRPKGKTEALFVALLLLGNKRRLLKMVDIAGHGTGKLNTDELKALKLTTPKLAEQQRISEFISSLDVQIEAEAEKLAVLNAHKDGLMQQIFPSLEGAK